MYIITCTMRIIHSPTSPNTKTEIEIEKQKQ